MKNPFKFNLVIFHDGTYGIRRGLLNKEYLDVQNPGFIWNEAHSSCKSLDQAKAALEIYNKPSSKFI